jgi:hypothetical protein
MIFTVVHICSDDFVDRPVHHSIDSENYFNQNRTMKTVSNSDGDFTEFDIYANVLDGEIALIIHLLE